MKRHRLPSIPSRLIRALRRGECIPFIGSGVSCQAGLPLWLDIRRTAEERIVAETRGSKRRAEERRFLTNASALEVFERCKQVLSTSEYQRFLLEQFCVVHEPSPLHRRIARLPSPFFVTTNFDELFEVALHLERGQLPRVCTRYDQIVLAQSLEFPFLVKLHGTAQDVPSIVLAESDYDRLETSEQPFLEFMRTTLDLKVVLFWGYSLKDPDMRMLLSRSRIFSAGSRRDDFAILKDVTLPEIELWRERGVQILPIQSFEQLVPLCDSMLAALVTDEDDECRATTRSSFLQTTRPVLRNLRKQLLAHLLTTPVFGLAAALDLNLIFVPRVLKPVHAAGTTMLSSAAKASIEAPRDFAMLARPGLATMIVGAPGAGKSMLLRLLAAWMCKHNSGGLGVYIPLGHCSLTGDVVDMIDEGLRLVLGRHHCPGQEQLELALLHKPSMLCFDGLDEASPSARSHVLRSVRDAMSRFPLASVVISSRFFNDLDIGNTSVLALQSLSLGDAQEVASRWLREAGRTDSEIAKITANVLPKAAELHENPLSVAAVCFAGGDQNGQVPTNTKVTRAVIEAIFQRALSRSGLSSLCRSEAEGIRKVTQYIAYATWLSRQGEAAPLPDVKRALAIGSSEVGLVHQPDTTLQLLTEDVGIMRPAGDGRLSFVNRSVHEMLVAEYVVGQGLAADVVHVRASDVTWSNVIRYVVGMCDSSVQSSLVDVIHRANPALSLSCLLEVEDWSGGMARLLAIENEDDLTAVVRTMEARLPPLQVVYTLEPLFARPRRNAHLLYFAVEVLEGISRSVVDRTAAEQAQRVLANFWGESQQIGIPPEMVTINPGNYWIGDDQGVDNDECPRHRVSLSGYEIGKKPVSNREFAAFVPTYVPGRHSPDPEMPATNITWYEATLYCRWILPFSGRLPREAEWEAAARGASDDRSFPWGEEPDARHANFARSRAGANRPGEYASNAIGLYDVAGNVFEWCYDWFDDSYYKTAPERDPDGPARGRYKVMRGGCWAREAAVARCSYRVRQVPDTRDVLVGFRVAKSL